MTLAIELIQEKKANFCKFARELAAHYNINERVIFGKRVTDWLAVLNEMAPASLVALSVMYLCKYKGNEQLLIQQSMAELGLEMAAEHQARLLRYLEFIIEVVQE